MAKYLGRVGSEKQQFSFGLVVHELEIAGRVPDGCSCLVQWKRKYKMARTKPERPVLRNNKSVFDWSKYKLTMPHTLYMKKGKYQEKECKIVVMLQRDGQQQPSKEVGRIVIDLAQCVDMLGEPGKDGGPGPGAGDEGSKDFAMPLKGFSKDSLLRFTVHSKRLGAPQPSNGVDESRADFSMYSHAPGVSRSEMSPNGGNPFGMVEENDAIAEEDDEDDEDDQPASAASPVHSRAPSAASPASASAPAAAAGGTVILAAIPPNTKQAQDKQNLSRWQAQPASKGYEELEAKYRAASAELDLQREENARLNKRIQAQQASAGKAADARVAELEQQLREAEEVLGRFQEQQKEKDRKHAEQIERLRRSEDELRAKLATAVAAAAKNGGPKQAQMLAQAIKERDRFQKERDELSVLLNNFELLLVDKKMELLKENDRANELEAETFRLQRLLEEEIAKASKRRGLFR